MAASVVTAQQGAACCKQQQRPLQGAARASAAAGRLRPAPAMLPFRTAQKQAALLRPRAAALRCRASAVPELDVETARKMLDGQCMVVDVRPIREYEDGRITKPPRKSINVPFAAGQDASAFVAKVASQFSNRGAQIIVMCTDGRQGSAEAAAALTAAGFTGVQQMQGGFAGYSAVWSPSGKRRPPAGRWVSTGKEALKSGLNIPGVAESYDEGGNLQEARWAQGLAPGQELPKSQ